MIMQSRVQSQQHDQCDTQKQMWPVKDYLPHKRCGHFLIAKDGDIARKRAMRCIANAFETAVSPDKQYIGTKNPQQMCIDHAASM